MSLLSLLAATAGEVVIPPIEDTTPYEFPTAPPYNVPTPALTPTPDGSGEGMHPSVIDFKNEGMERWNGYRYWMGMTPYTNQSTGVENPCILASHDGFTWVVPAGQVNPLEGGGGGYNSDTELVYDSDHNRLVLYWRKVVGSSPPMTERIRAAWSTDGSSWTIVGDVLVRSSDNPLTTLSPGIAKLGSVWVMTYIGSGVNVPSTRTATSPLGPWSEATPITLNYLSPPAGTVWHFGMTSVDDTLFALIDFQGAAGLACATSNDGITWNVIGATQVIAPQGAGAWDRNIYRTDLALHEDGDKFRVWYSAHDEGSPVTKFHTGYTQIPMSAWPAPPA